MAQNILQQYAIGIDIGGTNTKCGIVNHRGEIVFRGDDLPTNKFEKVENFVDELYKVFEEAMEEISRSNIKGIGIGAPNGNYYKGTIESAPNLHWKGVVP